METPRVSVIMPVYNREWCVAQAAESVLATRTERLELVIVDDGSTDGTHDIICAIASRNPGRVRVVEHPGRANRGIARSRNLGVRESRGDYLAFLDSDDLYLPSRFEHCLAWLDSHPDADACIEPYTLRDQYGKDSAPLLHLTGVPPGGHAWLREMLFSSNYWHTCCLTMRRAAFARCGGFDESLHVGEDTALWLRMAVSGHLGAAQGADPVALVRRHEQGHSWDSFDDERRARTYLKLLLRTREWSRHAGAASPALSLLQERLRSYAVELLCDAQLRLAFRLGSWLQTIANAPALMTDRLLLANLFRAPVRRVATRG